jgi:cation diffusion facilitator family transporter
MVETGLYATRLRAAILSLVVSLLLLGAKVGAYLLTRSSAIFSDALESVVHIAATVFVVFSVVLSARPPDRSHPYGHGKVEFFSAGFEGALIMLAAVAIIWEAGHRLVTGIELVALDVGVMIIAGAGVVLLLVGLYLIRVGRRTHSLTLEADGRHLLTDSFTSFGVVVGLLLVMFTGWLALDPLVAMAVAANILVTGGRLVYRSVRGLMDAADPHRLQRIVDHLSAQRRPGWIDVHKLRMLRIGDAQHIDLHLTVPRFWDVQRTHAEQEALERVLDEALQGPTALIAHLDPCEDFCCSFCTYEPCPVRTAACVEQRAWDLERITDQTESGDVTP